MRDDIGGYMTSYMTVSSLSRRSALRLVTSAPVARCWPRAVSPRGRGPRQPRQHPRPPSRRADRRGNRGPTSGDLAAAAAANRRRRTPSQRCAAAQPKTGGTLRFAATADVPNLDGHQRSAALTDTVWTAYDRLTQYDANGKVQPMLAESWDVTPDYKQVKFNLRKGVQFHTGRELTSDDVKWNILRVRDPKVGSGSYVTWSNWFTTIETPDKNTHRPEVRALAAVDVRLLRVAEHPRSGHDGGAGRRRRSRSAPVRSCSSSGSRANR